MSAVPAMSSASSVRINSATVPSTTKLDSFVNVSYDIPSRESVANIPSRTGEYADSNESRTSTSPCSLACTRLPISRSISAFRFSSASFRSIWAAWYQRTLWWSAFSFHRSDGRSRSERRSLTSSSLRFASAHARTPTCFPMSST